ncbi:hypothetical protein [Roseimaritima ulvae]|uniref:Uncharacterized protein n=1 Tax=Roseimaritima ulvae TaxID=980254 RepID=A0A5B9QMY7_9BACT|nr:hypothetical protein [Roseimaritima ulvae]QEG38990.1 hypothetical protein UC8_09510 [Roseimaritima ulvae]
MPAVSHALVTLRALLAVYGIALAAHTLQSWRSLDGLDVLAGLWSLWSTLAVVACGILVFIERAGAWRWAAGSAAVLVSWQAISALAEGAGRVSGGALSISGEVVWTLGDHAPRMAVALALAWAWSILAKNGTEDLPLQRLRRVAWLLCGASAVMFLMHAGKLIFFPASVEELLTRSLGRWNGYGWRPETVRHVLLGIGLVHVAAIIGIAVGRRRGPLCYMTVWGMMTSLSRLSAYSLFAWDEAFFRAANGGAALAALFLLPSWEPCRDESRLHQKDGTARVDSDR